MRARRASTGCVYRLSTMHTAIAIGLGEARDERAASCDRCQEIYSDFVGANGLASSNIKIVILAFWLGAICGKSVGISDYNTFQKRCNRLANTSAEKRIS
jgi:hypothetical protein